VHALCDLEARARRAGFSLVDPEGITRTLLVDLRASGAELSATLSGKTRKKLRARDSAPFVVRQLLDARHRDACEVAGFASLMRRGKCTSRAPWRVALRILKDDPTRLVAFGLFPRDRPDELVAFAIAERYGQVAEYLSAGALSDAEVRKYPFNYWLLWDIAEWARASGARWLDLGGISDGGPDDLLAGIAAFKHHFSHTETEVGREMMATLRPGFDLAVRAAKLLSRSERSP
jgi:hypothetical protein